MKIRSSSHIIRSKCHYNSQQFLEMKRIVAHCFNHKSKAPYISLHQTTQEEKPLSRTLSEAPSFLRPPSACYKNYAQAVRSSSVPTVLRIRSSKIEQFRVQRLNMQENNMKVESLSRFKHILSPQIGVLCKTCQIDRKTKPKLFKKRR